MIDYRKRSEKELRDALRRFVHNDSVMSLPVDFERDTDIIIVDGISELIDLRARLEAAERQLQELKD